MDKRSIRKLGVKEIEEAFQQLAIESMSQMLTSPAKEHNRRVDLLIALGDELEKRGSEGEQAIDRLATNENASVRYSICGTLRSLNMDRAISILTELATSPGSLVAARATAALETFEAMKRLESN